jgi:hypothetical protein
MGRGNPRASVYATCDLDVTAVDGDRLMGYPLVRLVTVPVCESR